ncbi:MAG: CpsB/CapC family capsule biosynthesis tyrosine phosphatase [Bacillota bacterium]|nr:CpsB/CapC family capsule biosynthesis tyrosine phosphatase [Bacillota bacterium]
MSSIDIHNHILPGLDDGPRSMSESLLLARALVASGFSTVVATPHSMEGRPTPSLILERLRVMQEELARQEIPLVVLPGSEPHIDPNLDERLRRGETLTLNNSSYILLELPFAQPLPVYTEELLFRLSIDGYRPIIPHPERTAALAREPQLLHRLHRAGAIFQVTWVAFSGHLGPDAEKLARYMLEANLVHLLATDAHNPGTRLRELRKAVEAVEEHSGKEAARTYLTGRPAAVIAGRPLDLPPAEEFPDRTEGRFSFLNFFRRKG